MAKRTSFVELHYLIESCMTFCYSQRLSRWAALNSALLNQLCYKGSPTRLVARAQTCAVIAVKIFVEGYEVPKIWIGLKLFVAAEDRAASTLVAREDAYESLGKFRSHLPEREHAT